MRRGREGKEGEWFHALLFHHLSMSEKVDNIHTMHDGKQHILCPYKLRTLHRQLLR